LPTKGSVITTSQRTQKETTWIGESRRSEQLENVSFAFPLYRLVNGPDFQRGRVVIDRCEGELTVHRSEGESESAAQIGVDRVRGHKHPTAGELDQFTGPPRHSIDFVVAAADELDPSLLPADVGKALSCSIQHDNAAGMKLLQLTEAKIEERGVSDAEGIYKVAQAYAVLGDKASALHMLRRSIGWFFLLPLLRA